MSMLLMLLFNLYFICHFTCRLSSLDYYIRSFSLFVAVKLLMMLDSSWHASRCYYCCYMYIYVYSYCCSWLHFCANKNIVGVILVLLLIYVVVAIAAAVAVAVAVAVGIVHRQHFDYRCCQQPVGACSLMLKIKIKQPKIERRKPKRKEKRKESETKTTITIREH